MTLPRFVGLLSIDGSSLAGSIAHFSAHFQAAGLGAPKVISFPREHPVFALLFREDARPGITAIQGNNGSIALIDGDLFEVDGACPTTTSDHEALLDLLEREQAQACNRFRSQASVVHWSAQRRTLTACRHQFGFSPIFFTRFQGQLIFAPDQKALLSLPIDRSLDLAAVDFLISNGYAPAPLTYLNSVRKVPAAHALKARPDGETWFERFFVPAKSRDRKPRAEHRQSNLKRLVVQALERRCGSGDVGVLLSAGVDSALMLGVLTRELSVRAEAFTYRYGDYEGEFNEDALAAGVAKHFGVKHHVVECGPGDVEAELCGMIEGYGEPFTYGLHSFKMGALKTAGLSRFFSGGGADCFNIDDSGLASIWYQQLPQFMRTTSAFMVGHLKGPLPKLGKRAYPFLWSDITGLPTSVFPPIMGDQDRALLYRDGSRFRAHLRELRDVLSRTVSAFEDLPPIDVWRYVDMQTFCAESMNFWVSAWSRGNGISIVDPYFDLDLVDYLMQVSPSGYGKRYLRDIAATMMPDADAYRPKIAQTIPIGHWMRGPLKSMVMDHLTPSHLGDIFDMNRVRDLAEQHMSGAQDRTWTLWALLSLAVWRDKLAHVEMPALTLPPIRISEAASNTNTADEAASGTS